MSKRRRLARESLEIYLVHLILAYRPLTLLGALLLLAFALATMPSFVQLGTAVLLPALYLFLLGTSFNVVLYTARVCAWIGTLGQPEG